MFLLSGTRVETQPSPTLCQQKPDLTKYIFIFNGIHSEAQVISARTHLVTHNAARF